MLLLAISSKAPNGNSLPSLLGFFIPIGLFAVSILQENTFSPQCIFPFMALVACLDVMPSEGARTNSPENQIAIEEARGYRNG